VTNQRTTFKIVYFAVVLAGILIFAATKMGSHTKDWRDGLSGQVLSMSTGPVATAAPGVEVAAIARDQGRLASDFALGAQVEMKVAIQDTNALIADLDTVALTSDRRAQELRSALSLVRNRGCSNCANLLAAALGP
jgi:hypothetical protein